MSPENLQAVLGVLERWSVYFDRSSGNMKRRPVLGGVFGSGGYEMASLLMTGGGLWEVHYVVMHSASGLALAFSDDKSKAMADAREVLTKLDPFEIQQACQRAKASIDAHREAQLAARDKRNSALRETLRSMVSKAVPKRRKAIFDKSEGKCHYCAAQLSLDGKWHIEHKMPRALFGGSEQSNLVASCVSCNLRKKDKTDLEFIAKEAARA